MVFLLWQPEQGQELKEFYRVSPFSDVQQMGTPKSWKNLRVGKSHLTLEALVRYPQQVTLFCLNTPDVVLGSLPLQGAQSQWQVALATGNTIP